MPTTQKIAVLGPRDTFSDIAADKYISSAKPRPEKIYARDIDEVFELVDKRKAKWGIVPIENMLEGTIRETLDNLFQQKVHIIKSLSLSIKQTLVTLPTAKKKDIKTIISHPQALKQCKNFLRKNFPKAEQIAFSSTGAAIEGMILRDEKSVAVIAPAKAAKSRQLKILAKTAEDDADNSTTFIIIERGDYKPQNSKPQNRNQQLKAKTSIAFHFSKDAPGSLFKIFQLFADAKINLTKIESRPAKTRFGDYIFYLDYDGPATAPILKEIKKQVAKLKILGSY